MLTFKQAVKSAKRNWMRRPQKWSTKGKISYLDVPVARLIIDTDMVPLLGKFRWYAAPHYASTSIKRQHFYLHHIVIGHPKKGYCVDHINQNIYDNRRKNLRIVRSQMNCHNTHSRGYRKHGLSSYQGNVCINRRSLFKSGFKTPFAALEWRRTIQSAYVSFLLAGGLPSLFLKNYSV